MTAWVADAFVLLGLAIVTVGVLGVARFTDLNARLHAASKAAFLGVVALLVAAAISGDGGVVARAVLITALLALTTPVASHAVAQAAHLSERRSEEERPD